MSDDTPAGPARLGPIVTATWVHTAIVAVTGGITWTGTHATEVLFAVVALTSFAAGFVTWIVAFAQALARTTHGDDVAVSNWVFLSGSVPDRPRQALIGAAAVVFVITIAVTGSTPFVWLTNLLPLALSALYGARHGTFPPRKIVAARGGSRGRRSQ